jgi:predicted NBD/HSP70 family sugar kinase
MLAVELQGASERLGVSTIVESDSHAITLAHHWFGKGRDLDDMVLVSLEHSLGLGVLHGGQLFRGAGGLSHNLGDLMMGSGLAETVRLSALAGEAAILEEHIHHARFADAVRLGRGMAVAETLIAAEDDALILAATRAGEAVGIAVANIVTLFGPPRVVIVGSSLSLGEIFLKALSESYRSAIPSSIREVADLVFDRSPDEMWAQGAAVVALWELYESPWSTTGPASTPQR